MQQEKDKAAVVVYNSLRKVDPDWIAQGPNGFRLSQTCRTYNGVGDGPGDRDCPRGYGGFNRAPLPVGFDTPWQAPPALTGATTSEKAAEARAWMEANRDRLREVTILELSPTVPRDLLDDYNIQDMEHREVISCFPEGFADLFPNLKDLNANGNRITSLEGFRCPISLERLHLHGNELSTLPENRDWLSPNIKTLSLAYNNFTSFPSLSQLPARPFSILDLSYNDIRSIPDNLAWPNAPDWLLLHGNRNLSLPRDMRGIHGMSKLLLPSHLLGSLRQIRLPDSLRYITEDNRPPTLNGPDIEGTTGSGNGEMDVWDFPIA